ncbi:hypothetical protein BKA70DRAFT_1242498 [Coprinopsis sp. MPI-PUGE-AT-0042]|nr:hypothetical protein BKA70DRAFT_1242498 [Coprinopsis sp. MPI-PUGE-AT-0042]
MGSKRSQRGTRAKGVSAHCMVEVKLHSETIRNPVNKLKAHRDPLGSRGTLQGSRHLRAHGARTWGWAASSNIHETLRTLFSLDSNCTDLLSDMEANTRPLNFVFDRQNGRPYLDSSQAMQGRRETGYKCIDDGTLDNVQFAGSLPRFRGRRDMDKWMRKGEWGGRGSVV